MNMTERKAIVVQSLIDAWGDFSESGLIIPSACILAASVGLEALRYHGVTAKAEPVSVAVLNAKALAHYEAGLTHDEIDWTDGSWAIGVDPDQVPTNTGPGWNGHLVLTVEKEVLLDLTLSQFNRPAKGIVLGPMAAPMLYDDFRKGERQSYDLNGCMIEYRRRPDIGSQFRRTPDWTSNRKRFTPAIIDRMAKHIERMSEIKPEESCSCEGHAHIRDAYFERNCAHCGCRNGTGQEPSIYEEEAVPSH